MVFDLSAFSSLAFPVTPAQLVCMQQAIAAVGKTAKPLPPVLAAILLVFLFRHGYNVTGLHIFFGSIVCSWSGRASAELLRRSCLRPTLTTGTDLYLKIYDNLGLARLTYSQPHTRGLQSCKVAHLFTHSRHSHIFFVRPLQLSFRFHRGR